MVRRVFSSSGLPKGWGILFSCAVAMAFSDAGRVFLDLSEVMMRLRVSAGR